MKLAVILAVFGSIFIVSPPVRADSPAPPVPWMKTAGRGEYLFKMVPAKVHLKGDDFVIDRESYGAAYQISEEGELQELWRTEGWYTFEGYLSEDGRYFVRIGPWASDQENHTDLAVAFYDKGKLLKEYAVRQLIKKPDLLEYSVSHYMWRPSVQTEPTGFYDDTDTFILVMIDKTAYCFDAKTGDILNTTRDEGAKTNDEIRADEDAAAKKQGLDLFATSRFKEDFERHFDISGIRAMQGSYSNCSLKGPSWNTYLVPKKEMPHKTEVHVVFPIEDDKRVVASITSQEILQALERAFQHPFVAARFEAGATGLRLRTQGDRLHWNTAELIEFLTKATEHTPKEDELARWAGFIIDAKEPRHTAFYFNTDTREILAEVDTKGASELHLLDAAGKRMNADKGQRE